MSKLKVGSDCSGVGAFLQAIMRLDMEYDEVFSCDFDYFARLTYLHNYGTDADIELGNTKDHKMYADGVKKIALSEKKPTKAESEFLLEANEFAKKFSFYYPFNMYERDVPEEPLDVYCGSFPCQSFSLAGKRKGQDDKRGILFYCGHEFILKNKPRYFIIENVKGLLSDDGGKTFNRWLDFLGGKSVNGNPVIFPIDKAAPYHVYWQVLNAKDYGIPQNRERVFIIGIRDDADNNFRFPKQFPLKKRLKDVLETDVDEKYFLKNDSVEKLILYQERNKENGNGFGAKFHDPEKDVMSALKTGGGGCDDLINVQIKSATKQGYEIATENDSINFSVPNSETRRGRVGKGVAQTLDTGCNQAVIAAIRGRNPENPSDRTTGAPTEQRLEINNQGLSNTLTSVQKDNVVLLHNIYGGFDESEPRIFEDYSPTIRTASGGGHLPSVMNNYRIRRLLPRECFRLQDFPDTFDFSVVSDSQAYRQAGNSIPVGVLARLIEKLTF